MKSAGLLHTGVVIVSIVALLAVFGPAIAPYDPTEATDVVAQPPPPLAEWPRLLGETLAGRRAEPVHWFGTDAAGLDVFSRTIAAPRTDLVIAVAANAFSFALGVLLGLAAGYFRHWSTGLLMRASDLLQSFPVFITAMILVALAGRTWVNIVVAMTLLYTPIYIRLTRTEVLTQRERGFVEAAQALGASEWRIALRHVLPNALAPAIVQSSVTIGFAILLTAGLSFVGAGVRPPTPEWGLMIATSASQIVLGEWWPAIFPGIAISLTVFGFAALGHALERRYGR
jgi:peptide/nickel transport system permease protein